MEPEMISKQMINFYETGFDSTLKSFSMFQEQMKNLTDIFSHQDASVHEVGEKVIEEWVKVSEKKYQNFSKFMETNLGWFNPEMAFPEILDKMWSCFRLPSMGEIHRLNAGFGLLESQLAALESRDWPKEITTALSKKGTLMTRNDLNSLKKAVTDMGKDVAESSEIDKLCKTTARLEAELSKQLEQLNKIEGLVAQVEPKLKSPSSELKDNKPTK